MVDVEQKRLMPWCFGPYVLDMENACLWRGDQRLTVRPKTFDILVYLVEHADELVTKETLLDAVWPDTAIADGVLAISVSELRKVLGDTVRDPQFIITVPRRGYRFMAPVTHHDTHATRAAVPVAALDRSSLVGREAELDQLDHLYTRALAGTRQIVLITGEAGIGKTTLIDAFLARLPHADGLRIGWGQCIKHYGVGEPYLPLLDAIGHLAKTSDRTQVIDVLRQHGPSWLSQLPSLLTRAEAKTLQSPSFNTTRERMLRELAESVETLTAVHPLILVLEDLHWSDSSTLDWLSYIARRRASARLLVLGTYRPIDALVRDHPVRAVTQELRVHGLCDDLVLDYLSEDEVADYLVNRFGDVPFSTTFCHDLHRRTNGNPLFVVNVINAMVQQGVFQRGASGGDRCNEVDALTFEIPETLRQFIAQQIQHLCPEDQSLLEAASVAGVEFSAEAVAAALELPPEVVETRCDALVRNNQFIRSCGIITWPDGTVTAKSEFQHALYAEVLYDGVPLSRRSRWHHRMGLRLESAYGVQAPEIAAELGGHFRRGQDAVRAVQYLQYAGENALQRHANPEAIRHLTQALALVSTLPDTPARSQQELRLRQTLGAPLVATQGYAAPDVEQTYTRAYTLCQQVGDVEQMRSVLLGLWRVYSMQGALQTAQEVAEQLLGLAQRGHDPFQLVEAHRAMGVVLFWLGDLTAACTHLEQGWTLYDRQRDAHHTSHSGPDVGVSCLSMATTPLWMLGYPDRAAARSEQAIALAQELHHPFSLAFALVNAARLSHFRREWHVVQAQAEAIQKLSNEHHFTFWHAVGMRWHGVALVAQGQTEGGMARIHQGHTAYQANGTTTGESYYRLLLAEAYREAGQVERGLQVMREAFTAFDKAEDRLYEAEMYRLKGELLLASRTTPLSEVDACFRQALAVARRQQAKSLELRAAMSWVQLGQGHGARDALADVYHWFTEGFDTADLQKARAWLEERKSLTSGA